MEVWDMPDKGHKNLSLRQNKLWRVWNRIMPGMHWSRRRNSWPTEQCDISSSSRTLCQNCLRHTPINGTLSWIYGIKRYWIWRKSERYIGAFIFARVLRDLYILFLATESWRKSPLQSCIAGDSQVLVRLCHGKIAIAIQGSLRCTWLKAVEFLHRTACGNTPVKQKKQAFSTLSVRA